MGIKHIAVKTRESIGLHTEWNDDHTIDGDVDFNQFEATQLALENLPAPPLAPVSGQIYFDTTEKDSRIWNGTGWVQYVPTSIPLIVVASDGTGDYLDVQSAINALPVSGGEIYVKPGTYSTNVLTLKSNVTISGAGWQTEIELTGENGLDCKSCQFVLFRNIVLTFSPGVASDGAIDVDDTAYIKFSNVYFWLDNTNLAAIFWTSLGGVAAFLTIESCYQHLNVAGVSGAVFDLTIGLGVNVINSTWEHTNIVRNAGVSWLLKCYFGASKFASLITYANNKMTQSRVCGCEMGEASCFVLAVNSDQNALVGNISQFAALDDNGANNAAAGNAVD